MHVSDVESAVEKIDNPSFEHVKRNVNIYAKANDRYVKLSIVKRKMAINFIELVAISEPIIIN